MNRGPLIALLVGFVIVAGLASWWFFFRKESSPSPPPTPTPVQTPPLTPKQVQTPPLTPTPVQTPPLTPTPSHGPSSGPTAPYSEYMEEDDEYIEGYSPTMTPVQAPSPSPTISPATEQEFPPSALTSSKGTYVVTASSSGGNRWPYHAFNKANNYSWRTADGQSTGWLQIMLPFTVSLSRYVIQSSPYSQSLTYLPVTFTLSGSIDGTNWNVLDTQTVTWTTRTDDNPDVNVSNGDKEFILANRSDPYTYYKLDASSNSNFVQVPELRLYGYQV